jgi:hypothetical protein
MTQTKRKVHFIMSLDKVVEHEDTNGPRQGLLVATVAKIRN